MTVPELVAYCKEQRQGESCPPDCALRKLGCSKFLPALWAVGVVQQDERREDAVDMVRHLVAAYGIYPEDAFPGIQYAPMTPGVIVDGGRTGPDSVPGQTTARVPNWYKAAIGKETSAPEEAAVCAAESLGSASARERKEHRRHAGSGARRWHELRAVCVDAGDGGPNPGKSRALRCRDKRERGRGNT